MKKFTLLLATMLLSVASFAAEAVYKTALFGSDYNSKKVSAYVCEWSATNNNFTVDIVNANNNNNKWAYIKMGSKKAAYVGTITTNAAIDKAITKVVLTIDAVTANAINSIKLKTKAADGEWTEAGTFTAAKGEQTVTLSAPAANLLYQIEVDCKKASGNGPIQISKVEYFVAIADVAATAIELDQTALNLEVGTSATLVATLTPAEATTAVVWTSSDETVATVNNGMVNAVKAGTATITATAGEGITATCEVAVREQTPKALAEIDYTTDGTEYKLAPITVVYVNGKSIYVQDATGAGLIYGSALTVNPGDLVSGLVVTTKVFNKLPELETTATNDDVTITSGTAPSPVEASAAPVAADVNKYLLLKDVVFAADATTLSGNYAQNVTASFKGEKVTIRDNFKITDGTILAGTYEIEGFVCLYNTTVQFYPTKITSTPTAIDNATVAEKAVKMIEDGQLVIIREGVKYNAQGAVIR